MSTTLSPRIKLAPADESPLAVIARLGAAFEDGKGPTVPVDLKCDIAEAGDAGDIERWAADDPDNLEALARAYTLLIKAARRVAMALGEATAPAPADPSAVVYDPPSGEAVAAIVARFAERLPAFAADLERVCARHGIYITPASGGGSFLSFWAPDVLAEARAIKRGPRVLLHVLETGAVLVERPLDSGPAK